MRNRIFILVPMMVAYLLMLSHDVIPHHHHETLVEAENHHAIEHAEHHHHDGTASAHEHTMHLVHSPEFGSYLPSLNSFIGITDVILFSGSILERNDLFSAVQVEESPILWFEGNPPPLLVQDSSSLLFRGPPKRNFFA